MKDMTSTDSRQSAIANKNSSQTADSAGSVEVLSLGLALGFSGPHHRFILTASIEERRWR